MSANMDEYINSGRACSLLSITPNTLRSWANAGKVKHMRTQGGQRRYLLSSVRAIMEPVGLVAGYILDKENPSGSEDRHEGERAIMDLSRGTDGAFLVYRDVGSPYDLTRPSLREVLRKARSTKVILYIHKPSDLAIIGYDMIVESIEACGGRVMVLSQEKSTEKEIVEAVKNTPLLVRCE